MLDLCGRRNIRVGMVKTSGLTLRCAVFNTWFALGSGNASGLSVSETANDSRPITQHWEVMEVRRYHADMQDGSHTSIAVPASLSWLHRPLRHTRLYLDH